MNIPEEIVEKAAEAILANLGIPLTPDSREWDQAHSDARAALTAAAPLLMAQAWELAPDELLNLPDGAIVIDRHGNPSRCEDGHLGRFITTDDMPFRVVYMPKERP